MKDLQTNMLAYENRQENNIKTWFTWKLNVFLKYFCDYGTNPVKSVIFSIWTILYFAFFYFFVVNTDKEIF